MHKVIPVFFIFSFMILQGDSALAAPGLKASYYSRASLIKEGTWKNGKENKMANGKRFDEKALTCATRLFPLGAKIKVTNLENGNSVIVKVTDRIGKRFANTRIDLSVMSFSRIAALEKGLIPIKVEKILGAICAS